MSAEAIQPSGHTIEHVTRDTPLAEILDIYRRDRVVVIDELAEPAMLEALNDEIREAEAEDFDSREDLFLGKKTRRLIAIMGRMPSIHPLVAHPLIVSLMEGIIHRLPNVQLNSTQVISVGPGEKRQNLHRDRWPWASLPLPRDFEYLVNCMWALTDFTAENGATQVATGSFLSPDPTRTSDIVDNAHGATLPDGRRVNEFPTVQAEMKAGSVLLWSGSLYHGGGENRSDAHRSGLSVTYTHSVLRQEENQYLIVPPEMARTLSEPLQQLLGYDLANYALGYVHDMKPPQSVFR